MRKNNGRIFYVPSRGVSLRGKNRRLEARDKHSRDQRAGGRPKSSEQLKRLGGSLKNKLIVILAEGGKGKRTRGRGRNIELGTASGRDRKSLYGAAHRARPREVGGRRDRWIKRHKGGILKSSLEFTVVFLISNAKDLALEST